MEEFKTYTPAAVLIPVFTPVQGQIHPTESRLLFTVRTETVENHKGQISFPGGRKDPEDSNMLETALRETYEEVGIEKKDIQIHSELPMVPIPRTKFQVWPFVGLIHGQPSLRTAPEEIAQVLYVPLTHLMDEANVTLETYEHQGVLYRMKAYHFEGHRIWGATARMLQLFIESLK